MRLRSILCTMLVLASACGTPQRSDDDDTSGGPDGGAGACTAGATIDCTCNDGTAGKASCLADGSRYGVCQCGAPTTCTPLSTQACSCGSQSGSQVCLPTGSWSTCECAGPVCTPNSSVSCTCSAGQSGTSACRADGSGYGPCQCASGCGSHPINVVGALRTDQGSIFLTGGQVSVTSSFRRGSDALAGCVGAMTVDLARADGSCPLRLEFGAKDGSYGGLIGAALTVDSACNALPASANGNYEAQDGYGATWFTGAGSLPDSNAAMSCASASIGFQSRNLVLRRTTDGATISLDLTGISLAGDLSGQGVAGLACVTPQCSPAYENVGDWCIQTPECGGNLASSISAPTSGIVGTTVQLDGSNSTGSGLRYRWSLTLPMGSRAALASTTNTRTSFVPDAPGSYTATLEVTDANGCTASDSATITVTQPGGTGTRKAIKVDLTWRADSAPNGDGGDLDIHLLGPAPSGVTARWFDSMDSFAFTGHGTDVFWSNKTPDWGLNNTTAADHVTADDPALVEDQLWGFGPEEISFPQPFDGTFRLGAHYYCSRPTVNGQYGATSIGTVTATVNVYADGQLVATYTSPPLHQRDLWEPATLTISQNGTQVRATALPVTVTSMVDTGTDVTGCTPDTN